MTNKILVPFLFLTFGFLSIQANANANEPRLKSVLSQSAFEIEVKARDNNVPEMDLIYGLFQRGYYLTAISFATALAEKDDANAQTFLGEMNRLGLGIEKNLELAFSWYKLGADNGNREAAFQVAFHYLDGIGTEKDKKVAASYFEIAADKGHVLALYNIGLMYLSGEVLEKSYKNAADRLLIAAKEGNADAQFAMGGTLPERTWG